MRCERIREAVSARLDGEPIGMSASALDHHLATCTDCARWAERAARLTRQVRLGSADVPDLAEAIVADVVLPARRVTGRRRVLRAALALVGLVQLGIAAPSLVGDSLGMAMAAHAAHESAAWNFAIGAAFVVTALRRRTGGGGLIALLATFVVVLAALSVPDVLDGAVGAARLATHIAALVGLVLLVAIERGERELPPGPAAAASDEHADDEHGGGLRGVA